MNTTNNINLATKADQPPRLPRLLNLKEVINITGIAKSTIYKKIDEGTFPRGMKISDSCVRWRDTDIIQWVDSLPSN